ncbi:uncharacterized protein NMK_2397 [Novimethylophilus kurashikiensis]|uniref:Uncharacterized protein n=1 Tax=Novimethylophilus kurashikiensis TaxID=1825523 RepID=A0A2R5F993_9PROT|nr:hypothetical protein [Novimethylophilus kurashikiensis]GBG14796.1 uncharacterized protein NMK_2397 [Novimethylophilus kurashikiensis]
MTTIDPTRNRAMLDVAYGQVGPRDRERVTQAVLNEAKHQSDRVETIKMAGYMSAEGRSSIDVWA